MCILAVVIFQINSLTVFLSVDGLKCHQCDAGKDCVDKSRWKGEVTCEDDHICEYSTYTNKTNGEIVDMQIGCEETDRCENKCSTSKWEPEIETCKKCCSTDLCNSFANSIVQSIVTIAVVSVIGMMMV